MVFFPRRCEGWRQRAIGPGARPAAGGNIRAAPLTGMQIPDSVACVLCLSPHARPFFSHAPSHAGPHARPYAGKELHSIPRPHDEQQGHNNFTNSYHKPCMHRFPPFRQAAEKAGGPYAPARRCVRLGSETRVGRFVSGRVVFMDFFVVLGERRTCGWLDSIHGGYPYREKESIWTLRGFALSWRSDRYTIISIVYYINFVVIALHRFSYNRLFIM